MSVPGIAVHRPTVVPPIESYGTRIRREPSAFARGEHERGLAVLVDDLSLRGAAELDVLLDLAGQSLIELVTTSGANGSSRLWIEEEPDEQSDQFLVHTAHAEGTNLTGIWPASQWLRRVETYVRQVGGDQAAIRARFLLAGAGEGHYDAIALDDIVPASATRAEHHLTLKETVALTGLFLRSRGQTDIRMPRGWDTARSIHDQRFTVSRFALHEGWRWWSACSGSPATRDVGWVPITRIEQAIRSRDEVLVEVLAGGGGAARDLDLLYHFDAMLVWLGSALDAVAQVTAAAHQVGGPPFAVGWLRGQWRQRLEHSAPGLFEMTEVGRLERAVLDLVAAFRNTIHGPSITSVGYRSGGRPQQSMVQLPAEASARAAAACDELGGRGLWGYQSIGREPEHALWDPYVVVQLLLPYVIRTLNNLMGAVDVEALPDVDPSDLMDGPPDDAYFDRDLARRMLLLHGLD